MATLYVVASPIGNLEDTTGRAARVLREVTVVYAEDTRRTKILLQHIGANSPLRSLHEHNERGRMAEVITRLDEGDSVALVTDAGTPAVSDPGAPLVRAITEAGHRAVPIPGASAVTTLLSVAGIEAAQEGVLFLGFLPTKGKERRAALNRATAHRGAVVLFEAPHRIARTLEELAALEPDRGVVVGRELTKMHEEIWRGTVKESLAWVGEGVRGELTFLLAPAPTATTNVDDADLDTALGRCLETGMSRRDAASAASIFLGIPKKRAYARVQGISKEDRD